LLPSSWDYCYRRLGTIATVVFVLDIVFFALAIVVLALAIVVFALAIVVFALAIVVVDLAIVVFALLLPSFLCLRAYCSWRLLLMASPLVCLHPSYC
jgi:hypothetical protein